MIKLFPLCTTYFTGLYMVTPTPVGSNHLMLYKFATPFVFWGLREKQGQHHNKNPKIFQHLRAPQNFMIYGEINNVQKLDVFRRG